MSTAANLKFKNSSQNCNFKEQDKVILKYLQMNKVPRTDVVGSKE